MPRHFKAYRNFAAEYDRLQVERVAAFREFIADVASAVYSEDKHVVKITDEELTAFRAALNASCPSWN